MPLASAISSRRNLLWAIAALLVLACAVAVTIRMITFAQPERSGSADAWRAALYDETYYRVLVDDRSGFIDSRGRVVIEPQFQWAASHFREGFAAVSDGGGYYYINRYGEPAFPGQVYEMAHEFSEGLAAVQVNGKYGFINASGDFIIEPRFADADPFCGGVARVGFQTLPSKLLTTFADVGMTVNWFYIDREGQRVRAPVDGAACEDEPPMLRAYVNGKGQVGYVNESGAVVIPAVFDKGGVFHEGRATVVMRDEWGLIDQNGDYIVEPQYDWIYDYYKGLAGVVDNQKLGYVDRAGRLVWPPTK